MLGTIIRASCGYAHWADSALQGVRCRSRPGRLHGTGIGRPNARPIGKAFLAARLTLRLRIARTIKRDRTKGLLPGARSFDMLIYRWRYDDGENFEENEFLTIFDIYILISNGQSRALWQPDTMT